MARRLKICHDRILPQELSRQQPLSRTRNRDVFRAVFEFRKMWINGSTLRVRFMEGTAAQKKLVRDHLGFIAGDEYLVIFPKDSSKEIEGLSNAGAGLSASL